MEKGTKTIALIGRIDSNNAAAAEQEILAKLGGEQNCTVILDADKLEYISSAGLRVILHLKKTFSDLRIVNVNPEVYEIFDMTGFTEMMPVEKAYRVVSVDGCEEIGRGANGSIYRIDQDNVVKVYNNAAALDEIQHEREVAKLALILGIPTAISYDVVRVGESYGSVFELLNASSFSKILASEPERLDWCVGEYVKMLKTIHSTLVPAGKLPDMKETALWWVSTALPALPQEIGEKLTALVRAIPHDDHMLHGDYHTKNLMLQGDEVLLIDMDTLAVGHPIFELGNMYNAYLGFYELDHDAIKEFQGFDYETGAAFWKKSLSAYLGTKCDRKLREVEDKARVLGYTRLISRAVRRRLDETQKGSAEIAFWKKELFQLLEHVDTLTFSPNELIIEAETENLQEVQTFVAERLEAADCPPKTMMQINIAVEEIFVNIASYAYAPEKGSATVRVEVPASPVSVTITFMDHGIPYDPLARTDPDISLAADERGIGGLGVFMTKKMMDDIAYEYRDGQNILTMKKNL